MSQATNRLDLYKLAQMVNLDASQTMTQIQELAKEGFLRKVGNGYCVTEKGKAAVNVLTPVTKDMGFQFYTQIGYPTVYSAQSLAEFYKLAKQIGADSLEFHLSRGDFQRWFNDVFGDSELSEEMDKIKKASLQGESLRKAILNVIQAKYCIEELL